MAMDGDRIEASSFNDRFAEKKIGSSVNFNVLRRDQLRNFGVVIGQDEAVLYVVSRKGDTTDLQKTIFKSWLNEK